MMNANVDSDNTLFSHDDGAHKFADLNSNGDA